MLFTSHRCGPERLSSRRQHTCGAPYANTKCVVILLISDEFRGLNRFFADNPVDPDDTLLGHYLIATWAKVCQAMGSEFEPYLPVVMPPLLAAASTKPDVSLYGAYPALSIGMLALDTTARTQQTTMRTRPRSAMGGRRFIWTGGRWGSRRLPSKRSARRLRRL